MKAVPCSYQLLIHKKFGVSYESFQFDFPFFICREKGNVQVKSIDYNNSINFIKNIPADETDTPKKKSSSVEKEQPAANL